MINTPGSRRVAMFPPILELPPFLGGRAATHAVCNKILISGEAPLFAFTRLLPLTDGPPHKNSPCPKLFSNAHCVTLARQAVWGFWSSEKSPYTPAYRYYQC